MGAARRWWHDVYELTEWTARQFLVDSVARETLVTRHSK